jgi:hypothetical protein
MKKTFADRLIECGFREQGFISDDPRYGRVCQLHSFQGNAYFRSLKKDLRDIKHFWVDAASVLQGGHFKLSEKLRYLENQRLPGVSGGIIEAGFALFGNRNSLLFQNMIHAQLSLEDVQQIDWTRVLVVRGVDPRKSLVLADWYGTLASFELFTFTYCDLVELATVET